MTLILETQRLLLKPILKSGLNTLHAILIDSYVRRYLCDDKIFPLEQVEEMVSVSQNNFAKKRYGLWFIETKNEQKIIGFAGLWNFFEEVQPQLVYALLPEAIKQGYATEAATKILEYSFDELNYQYLVASCDRPNLESQKLAERIGMIKVDEKIINGNPLVFFRIEKS
ncbi:MULTISPECIES: GNAT family N-acetyltransferase [Nostoc]|uniref:GNAT family N-acetyltransferase n=1 Tax=Nostoc paludosum FACHB-159 TaxID=2692908 RepID=A0ABR8KGM8_9NOSO|nr:MULTISPECIES: GNAT family N-acetyltransferase [Nostoc]MBD2681431.1 GNAT family N-acetyltransferase [Nostoc sp. FACHB-857]MBD2737889.1 GNAT family N-acetyltransferase [Nostoc paludosum FACHB-159]